jgi:murein DD-endopeptidase MepM/ murein hydrolase activator NlpD
MTVIASCGRCGGELAVHAGRPRILAGRVELLCGACWDHRDTPMPTVVAPVAAAPVAPRRSPVRRVAIVAGAIVIGVAGVAIATRDTAPAAAALPASDVAFGDLVDDNFHAATASDDPAPEPPAGFEPEADELDGPPVEPGVGIIATIEDEPIAERLPTLKDWVHPVTDSDERVPLREQRKFGALRGTIDREDCGRGHCGVDLAGPIGRPVVAVAWGTVVRVETNPLGRDGKTGRYVRIEHPDGVFTAYMHLDSVAPGLAVGDEVDAGRVIGTLGKSAIFKSEQHLHFSLEITLRGEPRFIDPSPFLVDARVVPSPARAEGKLAPEDRSQW